MPPSVLLAVLLGGALHAAWNVGVRAARDRRQETALVVAGAAVLSAAMLPFLPLPQAGAWPFLAVSAVLNVGYFALVAAAYDRASVTLAYPLMRGAAPALTALAAWLLLGEALPPLGWIGVLAVSAGVLLMARGAAAVTEHAAVRLALANAAIIAAYTLADGMGVRRSGHALAYTLWLFLLAAGPSLVMLLGPVGLLRWRPSPRAMLRALGGGGCTIGSYGLALWAMTRAPMAPVAALRETAMLFGLVLARLVLGERPGRRRWLAAGTIAAGAALLRLA
ncbi:EamA family transporter [Rhodovastum atsumiense]|uniref:EamA family transporter n=1 Tax=Rhodovastum atsumiense TaxID=504468 RepID=A0A5M6J2G3_9PROT|nr:EamA family transporter [Rhodovastum atsumiense]